MTNGDVIAAHGLATRLGSTEVLRGVDLDLATLLNEVGKKFGGSGGGHAAAAGVVIHGDLDQALEECVALSEKMLTGGQAQSQAAVRP